jgi:hypothetical protein
MERGPGQKRVLESMRHARHLAGTATAAVVDSTLLVDVGSDGGLRARAFDAGIERSAWRVFVASDGGTAAIFDRTDLLVHPPLRDLRICEFMDVDADTVGLSCWATLARPIGYDRARDALIVSRDANAMFWQIISLRDGGSVSQEFMIPQYSGALDIRGELGGLRMRDGNAFGGALVWADGGYEFVYTGPDLVIGDELVSWSDLDGGTWIVRQEDAKTLR